MSSKPIGIARSLAGRDKGEFFFVLSCTEKEVLLADGKHRKLERPKRKNLRHVSILPAEGFALVSGKLSDRPVNAELRRAMAEFKAHCDQIIQGGT